MFVETIIADSMTSSPAPAASRGIRFTYWVTTALVALMMAFAGVGYFTDPNIAANWSHLGFPDWFRPFLGTAKLLGAIVLLAPLHSSSLGRRLKEWAYAGFFFNLLAAPFAHVAAGDATGDTAAPVVFLIVLLVSYVLYQRLHPVVSR